MSSKRFLIVVFAFFLIAPGKTFSQKTTPKKYPSLFWEITGNGLKKPSYLFGTMHVSSKMAFHLSDSFYLAMKNVDAVALELNPDLWQGQMVRLDQLKENYANFVQSPGGDYLTENSFRINNYNDELKAALSTEPTIINNLLYRSYKAREDFEEDTFLDMYIFQTGKKLGKRSAGVEDYIETEKVVLEAYADMAKEKKKKSVDMDGESMKDIGQKIQDAYHSGDLDLMDSLDILTERSFAFREKFLYKRNEIQAGSIDTIIKKSSLFVGVGAAHLPGPRGVIELLRKMGYNLRPIKMSDRDAIKKEETDQLTVPVNFTTEKAEDGFYSVSMPGPLFKMKDEYQRLDRRQYSDMSNGSYYLVTRVKTFAAFLGERPAQTIKRIDSLLYENIPGKILKKAAIQKNGYSGFDIINKTRRGDLQRYNIFITPFEILVFKMSGKENYINGKEAIRFFGSIQLKENNTAASNYTPVQGGFSVNFPQAPNEYLNTNTVDGIHRWEYEAIDKATSDAYLILKKSVQNFKFLEEDSFDLKLIEESFRSGEYFDKQSCRKLTSWMGFPCLEVTENLKNGNRVTARYLINGAHYYCLAVSSKNSHKDFSEFFNSFRFTPYKYNKANQYVDSFLHFSVNTPIAPELDKSYRDKLEKVTLEIAASSKFAGNNSYWPKSKNALFTSDSTGETIGISIQEYPKYYSTKDSANFWKTQLNDFYDAEDLVMYKRDSFSLKNNTTGYRFILKDTGSSRTLNRMVMQKDNYLFSMVTIGDTIHQHNDFTDQFFSSFTPEEKQLGKSIYTNKLDSFFSDLANEDSLVHAKAMQSISDIYYGEKAVPQIFTAINHLRNDKDYVEIKTKLIAELGYIKDTSKRIIVPVLKRIYEQTADTSTFQNEVLKALARHRTTEAIQLFKTLVLQDPPLFDNSYELTAIFNNLEDSLKLAATLYPELLQLASIDDYKKPVQSLLATLVDSGYVKSLQYEDYFSKIYFDAKIELKKQQGKDEKKMDKEKNKDNDEEPVRNYNSSEDNNELNEYAVLLMPFYDANNNVSKFFDKLLHSKEDDVRLSAAIILLRNHKPVADSLLNWYAAKDKWRGKLYSRLEKVKLLEKFPAKYDTQLDLARSYLVADKDYNKIDSIIFAGKQNSAYPSKNGWVYFFKYRVKKEDDWKIGLGGLQPANLQETSSDHKLSVMTDRKLKSDKSENEQFQEQLKRTLFTLRKSGINFFEGENNNYHFTKAGEYEER
jgi:uncharacterized protein YbaP (TraB family)